MVPLLLVIFFLIPYPAHLADSLGLKEERKKVSMGGLCLGDRYPKALPKGTVLFECTVLKADSQAWTLCVPGSSFGGLF